MSTILNITNGDSSVSIMRQAKIAGEFLPWRDVLHEGPVPGGLSLSELSTVRANFISSRGWGGREEILRGFKERDAKLASFKDYDEVVLWFEHDLYDQLQILQVLSWFAAQDPHTINLSIICTNQYLGLLSPEQMLSIQTNKTPVTPSMLSLAAIGWDAFCKDSPVNWCGLLQSDLSALPFLKDAVIRLLEEYPDVTTGLSRTAIQAIKAVSKGPIRPHEVFQQNQTMEKGIFMGDSSFRFVLLELLSCNPALISVSKNAPLEFPQQSEQQLEITEAGLKTLAGEIDFVSLTNIDRWIGGVHLQSHNDWCWDSATQHIAPAKI